MKYELVWDAVDKLAKDNGLSPSGLAKKAGLDSTTFNKSKRKRPDGKNRWPSLDSINKILEVCNVSFEEFYSQTEDETEIKKSNSIPFHNLSSLAHNEVLKDKSLETKNWNRIQFPNNKDNLYAIDVDSEQFEPFYRNGDIVIVTKNSEIRKGDRVIIIQKDYISKIYEFVMRTANTLELKTINEQKMTSVTIDDVVLINRILWVSQ